MTLPTGNGEARGPESAPEAGTPLPSRPARAARNNATNNDSLGHANPAAQSGLGSEGVMCGDTSFMGKASVWPTDATHNDDVISAIGGDAGHPYGGS